MRNTASNGLRLSQAGSGEAADKRARLIQALIVSRRLRVRARLASRGATQRDAPVCDLVRNTVPVDALLDAAASGTAPADTSRPGR
ncbi:hypothetical protein ACG33_05620 [Steroidobacter denitrificans]|uniref:Uncharacterized protein n=2 Tax=Steroidobacter denitrificans TaxID=465721 RepID=A0A127F819_STEDE|nr:hypothetical protein ACG33_05620 [Steroidobacter denitrificans]